MIRGWPTLEALWWTSSCRRVSGRLLPSTPDPTGGELSQMYPHSVQGSLS
jgi:hypothetical protein